MSAHSKITLLGFVLLLLIASIGYFGLTMLGSNRFNSIIGVELPPSTENFQSHQFTSGGLFRAFFYCCAFTATEADVDSMFDESNVDWGARPIIENMYDLDNPDWFNPDSVKLIRYGEKSYHDKYAQLHILYGKDKNTTQTEWVNVYIFYVMD